MAVLKNDLRYLAGFFDGEGCIHTHDGKTVRQIRIVATISVSNTNKLAVYRWKRLFRLGGISEKQPVGNRRRAWIWRTNDQQAAYVLKQLLPFLKVKKQEAILFCRLMQLRSKWTHGTTKGKGRIPFKRSAQIALVDEIKRLKRV